MGLTGKGRNSGEGWGLGFLLVFFPEDRETIINKKGSNSSTSLSPSSSSSSPSTSFRPNNTIKALFKRTNSTHLLGRAQSTISICALLIFTTLLVFTLSTFEPTSTNHGLLRRQLSSSSHNIGKNSRRWSMNWFKRCSNYKLKNDPTILATASHALQGMGALYRRGSKAMNDLIVAHVGESVTVSELRLFLRLFHRSSLASRSDLLFIFPRRGISFADVIQEENDSFLKLVQRYKQLNCTRVNSPLSFDPTHFLKSSKTEEIAEPIWGRKIRSNASEGSDSESTRLSYGSILGFEFDELDPENSLSGLLDHVSMSLRKWACYPMLLGRVRRNFKHLMLIDVKEMMLVGDPLVRVRNQSPESVLLASNQPPTSRHGRKNSERSHQKSFNPALIIGGARGVRRLSNAMVTGIARAAMQQKRKNSVSESGLFSQLVVNEFILNNVNFITPTESVAEVSSVAGPNSRSASRLSPSNYSVIRRGNLKLNTDACFIRGEGKAGIGGVFRDHNGRWCRGYYGEVDHNEILGAELESIYKGLCLIKRENMRKVWVESDSKTSVDMINSHIGHHNRYKAIIAECNFLLRSTDSLLTHRWREGNTVADILAKIGATSGELWIETGAPPREVFEALTADAMGILYPRVLRES